MDDSSTDLFVSSTFVGSGEPEDHGVKRKQSSLISDCSEGSGDGVARNPDWECDGINKKARLDTDSYASRISDENRNLTNGIHQISDSDLSSTEDEATFEYEQHKTEVEDTHTGSIHSENGHYFTAAQNVPTVDNASRNFNGNSEEGVNNGINAQRGLSPTLRQTVELGDLNGSCTSADRKEEEQEELSPTLEGSPDFLDSPDSPDWLQDDYYEKRIQAHSSQKATQEAETESWANMENCDENIPSIQETSPSNYHIFDISEQDSKDAVQMEKQTVTNNSTDVTDGTIGSRNVRTSVKDVDCDTSQSTDIVKASIVDDHGDISSPSVMETSVSCPNVDNLAAVTDHIDTVSVIVTDNVVQSHQDDIILTDPSSASSLKLKLDSDNANKAPKDSVVVVPADQLGIASVTVTANWDNTDSTSEPNNLAYQGDITFSEVTVADDDVVVVNKSPINPAVVKVTSLPASTSKQDDVIIINDDSDPVVMVTESGDNSSRQDPGRSTQATAAPVPSLAQLDSIEQDANTIANILGAVDIEQVIKRLEQKRADPNRVDIVLNEVLEGQLQSAIQKAEASGTGQAPTGGSQTDDPLMADVQEVVRQVPGTDPNRVFYMLLETPGEQRVKAVVAWLKRQAGFPDNEVIVVKDDPVPNPPPLRASVSDPTDPMVVGDHLYTDMRTIAKIFPNKDQNEIYAYLEAHHNHPNRVQLVMDELLAMGAESQTPPVTQEVEVRETDQSVTIAESGDQDQPNNPVSDLQRDVDHLSMVFPDCDPDYIYSRLEETKELPDRTQRLAAFMFEMKNYPKLKDVQEKNSKEAFKKKLINMTLNMTEFLTMFPDPVDVFHNEDKPVTETYKQHAITQLVNYFPLLKEPFIKKILEKRHHHFTPALRELEKEAAKYTARHKNSSKYMKNPRPIEKDFPEQPDEYFFKELLYSRHEEEIKAHIAEQKKLRDTKLEEARKAGSLMECGCCFDDECIFEDMTACTDGHLFCKECVRRSSEVRIGENKFDFPCLGDGCDHKFQLQTLQTVLPHSVFSNVLRKMQEEEIKQADIPDLVSCPFCSFATIMPDPNDKVFKCLNPGCLKESCRLCKEPNHIPLRCEEVEKGGETSMRTFIENRITEAMLRTCWKCKKKFFKLDGCNKMTCTCGATMCYVCREPAIDYGHFNEKSGCAAFTDMNELHRQEMEKAAAEAKTKYEQENPGSSGLALKNDPMKLIEEMRRERERQQANQVLMGGMPVPGMAGINIFGGFQPIGFDQADVDNGEDYSDADDWSDEEREGPGSWEEEAVTDDDEDMDDYPYWW